MVVVRCSLASGRGYIRGCYRRRPLLRASSALRPMSGALAWLALACPLPLTRYVQRRLYLRLVLRRSPRKLRLCRHLLGP